MSTDVKIAVVTGGASGMGRRTALRLAQRGVKVAILDMNEEALASTSSESDNLTPFRCDVSDLKQVRGVIEKIETSLGPIDQLTHCAAIMPSAPLIDMPADLITKMMAINYNGTVHLTKVVLPLMQARKRGLIVIYGSIAGYVMAPELGAYNATKAATNAYAEVLIHENRGSGVHILAVNPPMVNTPLIDQAVQTKNIRESREKGRLASPDFIVDEVEKAIAKGKEFLYPGAEAKILTWLRRFSPGLLWRIIKAST
ncbi:NAD(P)-dependent dehydrogenase (short-subunit alcohol dehydrogenase family) [Litorivivens lipolytica]|uniref:NAD(P)-dependent dehydrogenase (Short-subunit alcohol dehydrogenase family) n=1 Tax=Litorivivens lipolytica TaxID=1524264 RepID=A0A7W4Z6B8_9GAMM|nr:SDR family oxidoreductase [Litorivivens lipolytica]MBB3048093.1 NAD(P)-dependent dehydrogenase (short-subunit alcohol dehydrogenase family) [Litorivivens lipolytica]